MNGTGVFGRFTDSRGTTFELLEGHRDSVKPAWRAMLKPWRDYTPPSPEEAVRSLEQARASVRSAAAVLQSHGISLRGMRVLEAGCYSGARAFALAAEGAAEVVGSDIPAYYLLQKSGVAVSEETLEAQRCRLRSIRERVGAGAASAGAVRFVEDDLCASSLPGGSFDMVCSWDVLEHLRDPGRAFAETARILRPGGVVFHAYNPFFALDGGHSLCTLDFPWGHARIGDEDFRRYLEEVRPDEAEVAWRFYRFNLNRMTLAECGGYARAAGFETLSLLATPDERHRAAATPEILRQVSARYPSATIGDLAAPSIRLLLGKA